MMEQAAPPLPPASSLSFSDGAFECESPTAILTAQRTPASAEASSMRPNHASHSSAAGASHHSAGSDANKPTHATYQQQQQQHFRHAHQLPLESQSINSQDLDDGAVEYGELAQPRAEIVLRWKRFALLVLVAAAAISGATALLVRGLPMTDVAAADAEDRVDWINSFSGIVMGFFESILGLLLGELLPVFIVYLHNLKWFPGDDPARTVSKFKKGALVLFVPLVMVALGNSFSAVQANQRTPAASDKTLRARHLQQQPPPPPLLPSLLLPDAVAAAVGVVPLHQTILRSALSRRVLPPPPLSASACGASAASDDDLGAALLQSLPAATFGFPARRWSSLVYPERAAWARSRAATLTPGGASAAPDALSMPSSTALELLAQGCSQLGALVADPDALPSALQSEPRDTREANASSLLREIVRRFQALDLGPLDYDAMDVTLQRSPLSSLVQLDAMTITIPVKDSDRDGTRRVVACGSASCVLLESDSASARRRLPRKHISIASYCAGTSAGDHGCQPADDAAFLFGFTSVTGGGRRVGPQAAASPQHTLVLSFAKLSWEYDAFQSVCAAPAASALPADCRVLRHELASGGSHLVLGAKFVASRLSASPVRLVQLLERKVALGSGARVRVVRLENSAEQLPSTASSASCSAAVDSYQQFVEQNRLFLDQHLVQPMYTAALLYLFQDAAVVTTAQAGDTAETAVARQLLDAQGRGSGQYIAIYVSNTRVGQVSTWVGCVALLVLSALVIVLPNERARLEPPKGGNARAERFVAVQTEEAYPNFVYKKRFLIGKTGEEIKFGEFAVESVSLHHKMEEDEQIYL
ncbi:hypothetical protein PybrP1_006929 [[Pythium] brassicae (nom. inval.)]|nr:hypothetical protein PybrP1_006929 [[Pythium] brassicae (nom. inval.)]